MSASTCVDTDFGNLPGCECCGAPVYREGVRMSTRPVRDMGPLIEERRQAFLEDWKDAWVLAADLEGAYWGRRAA